MISVGRLTLIAINSFHRDLSTFKDEISAAQWGSVKIYLILNVPMILVSLQRLLSFMRAHERTSTRARARAHKYARELSVCKNSIIEVDPTFVDWKRARARNNRNFLCREMRIIDELSISCVSNAFRESQHCAIVIFPKLCPSSGYAGKISILLFKASEHNLMKTSSVSTSSIGISFGLTLHFLIFSSFLSEIKPI